MESGAELRWEVSACFPRQFRYEFDGRNTEVAFQGALSRVKYLTNYPISRKRALYSFTSMGSTRLLELGRAIHGLKSFMQKLVMPLFVAQIPGRDRNNTTKFRGKTSPDWPPQ